MSQLIDVAKALKLRYEASDSGEWVRYACPHGGFRYIIRSRLADGYVAWCETGHLPGPEWYLTAAEAVERAPRAHTATTNPESAPPDRMPIRPPAESDDAEGGIA